MYFHQFASLASLKMLIVGRFAHIHYNKVVENMAHIAYNVVVVVETWLIRLIRFIWMI